tara:strand:- start:72 stop:218 length:147 start_codon:yes stop_codon:yes gene_type:complete
MSSSGDKRWEEKDDGISTLLRDQNEELFHKRRKYTVAISEIKKILESI